MSYVRSFNPVTAFVTFISSLLMLFGLVSGCVSDPASTSTTNPEVSQPAEQFDTGTSDTNVDTVTPDAATQALIDQNQLNEEWIAIMDPFMTTNQNWTFTFTEPDFLASINTTHPEVVAYYEGTGLATDDTVVIDELLNGLPIANEYVLEQYNELTQNGTVAPPPSVYGSWQWYGYKISYTGADADRMIASMASGGAILSIPVIGWIGAPVLSAVAGTAYFYDLWYGGFSIRIYWSTNISISAP